MSLTFPNRSRSYDEAGKRIRFVGHDGMFQISFSVAADAMTRMQPATAAKPAPYAFQCLADVKSLSLAIQLQLNSWTTPSMPKRSSQPSPSVPEL